MKSLLLLSVFGLMTATSAGAQGPIDEKAIWEAEQLAEQVGYKQRFTESGFVPIEEIDAGDRNVRRLSLRDPYGMLPIPGVEFEKRRDGKVTMRLQYWEYRTEPVAIGAATWDRIVAGDKAMFAALAYKPVPREPLKVIPPVCHGWMALVQASGDRAASWWECRDTAGSKQDYVKTMLEAAFATRPDCKAEDDPRWAFQKCFGEKEALDDPKLSETYSRLSKDLYDAPSAATLAAARMALRAPGLTLGSPAWREARVAVQKILEVQSSRRATLQKLIELDYRSANASQIDKLKMRRAIRHWSETMARFDANHVEILRGLAWAGE